MNLKWTHTGETTRDVLLAEVPVFCDFIHIGQPQYRVMSGENLDEVAEGSGVMWLDVQVATSGHGHLLEPGMYRCHLILAAENSPPRQYVVEIQYAGIWSDNQDQMFDNTNGFRMKKV